MDAPNIDTKTLFAPKKGKQATKGQKQIYEGNQETLKFFTLMAVITILARLLIVYYKSPTYLNISFAIFAIFIQVVAVGCMRSMCSKAVTSGKVVLDGGIDLNLAGGFADYLKDIIITTSACSVLSIVSEAFWLLWLWIPAFWAYKVWSKVIGPWIFQPAPEESSEVTDKKKKKLERKMARAGYR